MKSSGQSPRGFFRFKKTAIDIRREQFIEKRFQKRKLHFLPSLTDFLLCAKIFARFAEPAIYVSVEAFGEFFFETYIVVHTSLEFLPKKSLVGKHFPGCHNCNARFQRHFLRKKEAFKTKLFLFICFEVWAIFFVCWQKSHRVKKTTYYYRKKLEENVCTKIVFNSNQFRISSRIVGTLRQKLLAGL